MYTTYIGKQFLKLYNQKTGSNLTAKQFFNDIMFPLFFDNEKAMMQVSNSPFFQHSKKRGPKHALSELNRKISEGEIACDVAVGYPAAGITGTTTGQISSVNIDFSHEDVYASWIGGALGIGVAGGYLVFIDDAIVLWNIFEGWQKYRDNLNQIPNLKPNQITTWNGQWLAWASDGDRQSFSLDDKTTSNNNIMSIETVQWSKIIFALTVLMKDRSSIMSYVCNFGQMNESLGFIELILDEVDNLFQLRQMLSGISDRHKFTSLYETKSSFRNACQLGAIGLQVLEPKELDIEKPINIKKLKEGDEKTLFQYNNNLIWRTAMLNNQELLDLAKKFAQFLKDYSASGDKGKTAHKNIVESLLVTKSKSNVVNQLADILIGLNDKDKTTNAELLNQVVQEINSMNLEKLKIFISLTRYVYYSI
jgi:hypothetical protein